ncbi:hypothetical protein J2T13_004946 [Paenibacillus sp. DS2015]|uniref:phage scaffolding protein n=1 Tax=Paenibacillus sp. DS2015 TaxID=3373917 RepID=UPI003D1DF2DC
MTKEQFIALGFTEEQATKAADASQEELKTYIPKHRFEEVTEENKTLKGTVKESEKQLETLKTTAGASEELKKEIEKLQGENKTAADKYTADLKELTLTNAIKTALNGKVHDEGMVAGLLDKNKLVIDGDKVVGLEDQLKVIQESKAFLFKSEEAAPNPTSVPGFRIGTDGKQVPVEGKPASLMDAVSAHFNTK